MRKIIADYIQSDGIRQWIEPVTLFDKDFKEKLGKLGSKEAVASAMEHAARRAITARFDDNPIFYTDLLEKLKLILAETKENWDIMRARLEKLHSEILTGEQTEAEQLGMDPKEYALYRAIKGKLDQLIEVVRIKEQEKRWGSCAKDGTLYFNWRGVLAPAHILDYIVVHELCHLIEQRHSSRFWSLLRAVMPGYELRKNWLMENGAKLNL